MEAGKDYICFEEFVKQFRKGLYSYARHIFNHQQIIDDAVQEAFIHIWHAYQKTPGKWAYYYLRCGKGRILTYRERQDDTGRVNKGKHRDPLAMTGRYQTFSDYEEPENYFFSEDSSDSKNDRVIDAVEGKLNEKQRYLVESRFWEMAPSQVIKYDRKLNPQGWKTVKKILEEELKGEIAV